MYICLLGVLWLLCSLPIVTAGASTAAVYAVFFRKKRLGEKGIFTPFFTAFRRNFKQATALGLIVLAGTALLGVDGWYYLVYQGGGGWRTALGVLMLTLLLGWLAVAAYVFPLQALYENSVKGTLLCSARSALTAWPWTLAALAVAAGLVCLIAAGLWQLLLFGMGILAWANTHILTHALAKDLPGGRGKPKIEEGTQRDTAGGQRH